VNSKVAQVKYFSLLAIQIVLRIYLGTIFVVILCNCKYFLAVRCEDTDYKFALSEVEGSFPQKRET